jgi:hypothetical protein
MAEKLSALTKDLWKQKKAAAGVKKAGFLQKDASVGKYIEAYLAARATYKQGLNDYKGDTSGKADKLERCWADVVRYKDALEKLGKAFKTFNDKKDFEGVPDANKKAATDFQNAISEWAVACETKVAKLKKFMTTNKDTLKANDKTREGKAKNLAHFEAELGF